MAQPVCIAKTATEFHRLKADLAKLAEWEGLAEPTRDRMAALTLDMAEAVAETAADLALKAGVPLDWLEPVGADISGTLSASLCRDILLLFPGEPPRVFPRQSEGD